MSISSNVHLSFRFNNYYIKSHYFLETVLLKETIDNVEFIFHKTNASEKYNVQPFSLIIKSLEGNKVLKNLNFPCVTQKTFQTLYLTVHEFNFLSV